jgi:flavodoxin
MNISLIYLSKTGHSKKLAEAIAAELQIPAQDIKTNPQIKGADLLFIVGGIYGGKSDPKMIEYITTLDNTMAKKAALITSCCSKVTAQSAVREELEKNNIEVLKDEFICQGSFLLFGFHHPNKTDIQNAVSYAKSNKI